MTDQVLCQRCDRAMHDPEYPTCFGCFLERAEHYVPCLLCGRRHAPDYPTCFRCRVVRGTDRADAAHRLRRHVLERDDFTCEACGWRSVAEMQVDHLKPCARGRRGPARGTSSRCAAPAIARRAMCGSRMADGIRCAQRLLHDYFLTLRVHLEPDQRVALREAIEVYRRAKAPRRCARRAGPRRRGARRPDARAVACGEAAEAPDRLAESIATHRGQRPPMTTTLPGGRIDREHPSVTRGLNLLAGTGLTEAQGNRWPCLTTVEVEQAYCADPRSSMGASARSQTLGAHVIPFGGKVIPFPSDGSAVFPVCLLDRHVARRLTMTTSRSTDDPA